MLATQYVPSPAVGTGFIAVNEADWSPHCMELLFGVESFFLVRRVWYVRGHKVKEKVH